jgi:hypothetical protein
VSPAAEVRAAAAKLRETATVPSCSPWVGPDQVALCGFGDATSAWITLMQPAIAEPLAALFDQISDDMDDAAALERKHRRADGGTCTTVHPTDLGCVGGPRQDWAAALTAARVITGGAS